MTRVVFWNVENFTLNKIANVATDETTLRCNHRIGIMLSTIFGSEPVVDPPDIVVIVEYYARHADVGSEGSLAAGPAAMLLLDLCRHRTRNDNWMLVPPVRSGLEFYQEAVAVYYNSDSLQFVGPYVWGPNYAAGGTRSGGGSTLPNDCACPEASTAQPADYHGPACPSGPQTYPDKDWAGCLPDRAAPAGFTVAENLCAGRWEHLAAADTRINFPASQNRGPWFTQFVDLTANNRVVRLFAVHTSPDTADSATRQLANVPEIAAVAQANTVDLIVGDFNVDTFGNHADAYRPLLDKGFNFLFDARGNLGDINQNWRPYLMTHLLPRDQATPFSGPGVDPRHNVYPRYGYMGGMSRQRPPTPVDTGAIDNGLVRHGSGLRPPRPTDATILNLVVGSPYTGDNSRPLGTVRRESALANPVPAGGYADPEPDQPDRFQGWMNFEKIRSTSDHLALSMVI